ncbi:metalloprotease, partial [Coemansia sp. RSA 2599]
PFFNQLRNVQQLGYTVGVRIASVISHRQVIQFYVQGTRDSEYLAKRVQMFIKDYLRTLKNYDEKALKHLIGSIVDAEVARQSNKAKAVSALWSQIAHGELCFLQGQPLIDCLNSITRKDLVQFWLKYICDGAASDLTCVDVHL